MLSEQITIVEDVGGGELIEVDKVLPSTEFAVKLDGQLYSPAITTQVEIENDGETTSTMDQCGHTQRTRSGDNGWLIRVQGIVTGNDDRPNNLSLSMLRDVVAGLSTVEIRSDIQSGRYEVSNTVITQANDLVSVNTADTDGEEKAFEFQLQLGETETE